MFDGFRPAPQRPAPESTPAGEREKAAPKRGMFDGLKLSAAPLKGAERAPVPADRGQGRDYARAVERASRSAGAVLQARASGAPASGRASCRGRESQYVWISGVAVSLTKRKPMTTK